VPSGRALRPLPHLPAVGLGLCCHVCDRLRGQMKTSRVWRRVDSGADGHSRTVLRLRRLLCPSCSCFQGWGPGHVFVHRSMPPMQRRFSSGHPLRLPEAGAGGRWGYLRRFLQSVAFGAAGGVPTKEGVVEPAWVRVARLPCLGVVCLAGYWQQPGGSTRSGVTDRSRSRCGLSRGRLPLFVGAPSGRPDGCTATARAVIFEYFRFSPRMVLFEWGWGVVPLDPCKRWW